MFFQSPLLCDKLSLAMRNLNMNNCIKQIIDIVLKLYIYIAALKLFVDLALPVVIVINHSCASAVIMSAIRKTGDPKLTITDC